MQALKKLKANLTSEWPSWTAGVFSFIGAVMVANVIGEGYYFHIVGSSLWVIAGYKKKMPALCLIEGVYFIVNIMALFTWDVL